MAVPPLQSRPVPHPSELARIRAEMTKVRRLSENLFKVGPVGIGLDGLISWVPGAGLLYTLGAGGYLMKLAWQAGAPESVMRRMAGWIAADGLIGAVPIAGDVADVFFRGHAKAAVELEKHLDAVHPEGRTRPGPGRWRSMFNRKGRGAAAG